MVTGFTTFKEKFQGFENEYVVIGGTAEDMMKLFLTAMTDEDIFP